MLVMIHAPLPVAALSITIYANGRERSDHSEPVYGGYANARGEVVLFAKELAYRVNFKNQTLREGLPLNAGAQARYDATAAGEEFQYGNKQFRRLSHEQIAAICTSHRFRMTARY
jgi:hypothetical protein